MCSPKPVPPFPFPYCCIGSGAHLLFRARQPAKAPGGHINYIAAPPLFSQVYPRVCLLSQTVPICSLSIFTAVCVRFYIRDHKYVFAYAQIHSNRARTPAPSPWQVIMVGGKILPGEHSLPQAQLYNRFRCVYVCVCGCIFISVCICGCLNRAWLPLLFMHLSCYYFNFIVISMLKWKQMHA